MKRIILFTLTFITLLQPVFLFSAEKIDLTALAGKSLEVVKAKFPSGEYFRGKADDGGIPVTPMDSYAIDHWRGMYEIVFYFGHNRLVDVRVVAPLHKKMTFKKFSTFLHDNLGIDLIESPEKPFYYGGQAWNVSLKEHLQKHPDVISLYKKGKPLGVSLQARQKEVDHVELEGGLNARTLKAMRDNIFEVQIIFEPFKE